MAPVWEQVVEHELRNGSDETRCDAFTTWAFRTRFRDALPADTEPSKLEAVWLMLELRRPVQWLIDAASTLPRGWLHVPEQYRQALRGIETTYCTALASRDFISYLVDPDPVDQENIPPSSLDSLEAIRRGIKRYEIGMSAARWDESMEAAPPAAKLAHPPPAVIGVVDDGLPFAHERFCWTDEDDVRHTRFLAIWDQSARQTADSTWCLGRTLAAPDMEDALRVASVGGQVDEDLVYHAVGMAHLLRHRITHGAHVTDLACGMAPPRALEAAPAIIGVQLRPMESTLCISSGAHVFDAIRYVVAQADAVCGEHDRPIVVNASLGNIAGPHDGTSMIESAIDEMIRQRRENRPDAPIDVVLPEGNSYLSRCHAWIDMASETEVELGWHLQPDDGTSSYLEIWLRPQSFRVGAPTPEISVSLSLTPPGGPSQTLSLSLPADAPVHARESALCEGGETIAVMGLHSRPANGRHWMGLITVAPTAPYGSWKGCAPVGVWKVKVSVDAPSVPLYCNIYSQRDEKSFGHRGWGRQAVLEDDFDRVYDDRGMLELTDGDSFRRRVGTINGLANGKEVHVVGGLVRQPDATCTPAPYSSVSIPTDEPAQKLRALAVTEDSSVLQGVHAAGTRSGSVVALSGTSMAAPQQARVLAFNVPHGLPIVVEDFNQIRRRVIPASADLAERSRQRRGD